MKQVIINNMHYKYFLNIAFLSFVLTSISFAQNIKEELFKINKAYKEIEKIYIEVIYKAYDGTSGVAADIQKGAMAKGDHYLYNKIGETETIIQDSIQLIIDHSRRMMVLTNRKETALDLQIVNPGIEKALVQCKKIMPFNKGTYKGYELWMGENDGEKIYFSYSPDNYMIHGFEFFYKSVAIGGIDKKNVRMEIEYHYPKDNRSASTTIESFLKKEEGGYTNAPSYTSYQFVDYTLVTGKTINR